MYSSPFVPRSDPASAVTAATADFSASQSHDARCEDIDSLGAHAITREERGAELPQRLAQVARLSQQLQGTFQEGADFVLVADELELLQRALAQADLTMLPPDRRESLHPWLQILNDAIRGARLGGGQNLRVQHADLETLAGLLQETIVTSSKLECGDWVPLEAEDRRVLRELANWMQSGSVAQLPKRCEVGRQVLLQSRGLISDIHFGSDTETPDLPDVNTLHALMDASTLAHVSLGGGIDRTQRLEYSLAALPLRTWRLGDAKTLAWVIDQHPANLRTLDLRPWKGAFAADVDASDLLRRASDELPNLAEILLPERASADALSDAWTAGKGDGWQYIRRDRPDGLALLDAAVDAWEGMVVGTRMAIRHKASQPDAAELLKLARTMAPYRQKWVADALIPILNGAARSDEVMHRCANAYRAARVQSRSPETHLKLTQTALHAAAEAARQQPARPSQPPRASTVNTASASASARRPPLVQSNLDTTTGPRFLTMPLAPPPRVLTSPSSSRSSPLSPSSPLGPLSPTEKAPGLQASKSSGRSGSVMSLTSMFEQHSLRGGAHRSAAPVDDSSDATETRSAGFESDTEGSVSDWETASTTSTRSARSFAWSGGAKAAMGLSPHHRVDTAPHLLSRKATPGPKPMSVPVTASASLPAALPADLPAALPISEAMEVAPPSPGTFIAEEPAKVVILQRGQVSSAQRRDEPTTPGQMPANGATTLPMRPFLSTFSAPKRQAPAIPERPPVGGPRPAAVPARSVPLQQAATEPAGLQEAEASHDFGTLRRIIARKLHATSEAP
ncbi:hypothetical protein [Roseateles depolymerans]|uniref:Uncharacterized protein n=1 Tax=Roseateles depolymerans TaxID=76731 RepID=A0A0U3MD82_9BURK|nr:hypothetical protein [Roseateles depolymerans]ALV05404.1 hypothetical protein RD2015_908 [Roseateles depolymerans]REG14580.1 hypothetical protein DES44_3076 [Roseateles depolymerans]